LKTQPSRRSSAVASPRLLLVLSWLCLAAGALACSNLPPPRSTPSQPSPARPSLSAPATGQREVRLTLAAGRYVRLAILSTPVDLVLRQLGPDGSALEELHLALGGMEVTHLSWLIPSAGEYRWTVVTPAAAWPAAGFAIWLDEERPAGPCDELRLHAERALLAGEWELRRPGAEALAGARARALVEPARVGSEELGELTRMLATQLEIARAARLERSPETGRLLEKALELARGLGDQHAEALLLEDRARLPQPLQVVESLGVVLESLRRLGDEMEEGFAEQLLANELNTRGETELARQSFRRALALQWRNEDWRRLPWTMGDLGFFFGDLGEMDSAFRYLDSARELGRVVHDTYAEAYAIVGRARFNIDMGSLQAASDDYTQARDLLASTGTSPQMAWALDGLARVRLYLGDPERARQTYREALEAFENLQNPWGRADALLGIGSTFEQQGEAEHALEPFRRALDIIRANRLLHLEGLARYDLGKVHRELRQPAQALPELESALALAATDSPVRQAQIEVELANADSMAGRIEAAESAFKHAIELSGRAPIVEAAAQAGLARLQRDHGDPAAARRAIARALELTERLRSGVIRPDQRVSFLAARRGYYEFYVDLLMRLERLDPGAGHAAEAVAVSEQARARGLLDLLAKEQVDLRHGIPAELKEREARIGDRIARLQTLQLSSAAKPLSNTDVQRLNADLGQAEEEEKDLEAEIRRRDPSYAAVRTPSSLRLQEIQALLDERTALLEYFQGDESSFLFVVTRQGLTAHLLPPRRDLAPLLERLRAAVYQDSPLGSRRFAEDAYELYRVLMLPAEPELRGKERLVVAPDGALYSLSFELLLTAPVPNAGGPRRDLPYLIRERSVSYVPSASVLAQLVAGKEPRDRTRNDTKLFVGFGDPGEDASRLPAARDEVRRIASLFPVDQAVVFIGPDATEGNVKSNAAVTWARNLHFATHGLLDEDHPDRSGLKLAQAKGSTEDGLLQVREVFNLELHADLVILSACQSGRGKEVSGEGLVGMTRAFLYAGAGRLIVSLWRVDDESTSDLMVSFYRHLLQVGDHSAALQLAKLDLIDHSQYFHPYFWAPFVLVGLP
jgi:CHAT domain-containing protein